MNPDAHDDDARWLDALLARSAAAVPVDDGFCGQVMRRVDTVARAAAAAEPASCIAPAAALRRLPAVQRRERRRQSWTTVGVVAAAAVGMLTLWAQPGAAGNAALTVTSIGLLWLLVRDPQF